MTIFLNHIFSEDQRISIHCARERMKGQRNSCGGDKDLLNSLRAFHVITGEGQRPTLTSSSLGQRHYELSMSSFAFQPTSQGCPQNKKEGQGVIVKLKELITLLLNIKPTS
jgi:hypothetical protein